MVGKTNSFAELTGSVVQLMEWKNEGKAVADANGSAHCVAKFQGMLAKEREIKE